METLDGLRKIAFEMTHSVAALEVASPTETRGAYVPLRRAVARLTATLATYTAASSLELARAASIRAEALASGSESASRAAAEATDALLLWEKIGNHSVEDTERILRLVRPLVGIAVTGERDERAMRILRREIEFAWGFKPPGNATFSELSALLDDEERSLRDAFDRRHVEPATLRERLAAGGCLPKQRVELWSWLTRHGDTIEDWEQSATLSAAILPLVVDLAPREMLGSTVTIAELFVRNEPGRRRIREFAARKDDTNPARSLKLLREHIRAHPATVRFALRALASSELASMRLDELGLYEVARRVRADWDLQLSVETSVQDFVRALESRDEELTRWRRAAEVADEEELGFLETEADREPGHELRRCKRSLIRQIRSRSEAIAADSSVN